MNGRLVWDIIGLRRRKMGKEKDFRTPEQIISDALVQEAVEDDAFSRLTADEVNASLDRARAKKEMAHLIHMQHLRELTVVAPSFHSPELTQIMVRSFERFRPTGLHVRYVIVENSDDTSYRDSTIVLAPDRVLWVQNPVDMTEARKTNYAASLANAWGVTRGLQEVMTEWVFIAHNDVCVASTGFFEEMDAAVGYGLSLWGTVRDNIRINAIHVSGMLTRTEIARRAGVMPTFDERGIMTMDVGDAVDALCRAEGLGAGCMMNTENFPNLPVASPFDLFHVDRAALAAGEVVFMHLGRGSVKNDGLYSKPNRVLKDGWVEFCEGLLAR